MLGADERNAMTFGIFSHGHLRPDVAHEPIGLRRPLFFVMQKAAYEIIAETRGPEPSHRRLVVGKHGRSHDDGFWVALVDRRIGILEVLNQLSGRSSPSP